ncbi:MAG TPA: DUF4862 family protein, partial [Arthrobacter sp.]
MLESAPANNQPRSGSRRIPVVHRKEVPTAGCLFTRHIHLLDTPLLDVVRPHFQDAAFVVTTIPGTAARLQQDPRFGLASTSAAGRHDALKFVRNAFKAVDRMNSHLGR